MLFFVEMLVMPYSSRTMIVAVSSYSFRRVLNVFAIESMPTA